MVSVGDRVSHRVRVRVTVRDTVSVRDKVTVWVRAILGIRVGNFCDNSPLNLSLPLNLIFTVSRKTAPAPNMIRSSTETLRLLVRVRIRVSDLI